MRVSEWDGADRCDLPSKDMGIANTTILVSPSAPR